MVLVGPSACGKTTVLRLIAGLEAPSTGQVLIGGDDVTDRAPGARDVAMVFQNDALYPHLSVRENIEFPLRMRQVDGQGRARRAREVAESLGIDAHLDRRPAELSRGQRQRVALARALVREPAVFLFDEPLSSLDAQARAAMRSELVRLHRRLGCTIIHVTHDQAEAMSMAQRVAVMHHGRIEQCAPPMELYASPATRFTAEFVGAPTINAIPGRVEASGSAQLFVGVARVEVSASLGDAWLAVRPEHVRLVDGGGDVQGSVTMVEALGSESIAHVRLPDDTEVRVRVSGSTTVLVGATVGLEIDASQALVFDQRGRLVGRGRR
jgi:ABC-type sugar transport system ATPase subunit